VESVAAGRGPDRLVFEQTSSWVSRRHRWPSSLGGDGVATVSQGTARSLAGLGYRAALGGPMNSWAFGVPQDRVRAFFVFARTRACCPGVSARRCWTTRNCWDER
jgi:site-specific DNA-cytosine methylase